MSERRHACSPRHNANGSKGRCIKSRSPTKALRHAGKWPILGRVAAGIALRSPQASPCGGLSQLPSGRLQYADPAETS